MEVVGLEMEWARELEREQVKAMETELEMEQEKEMEMEWELEMVLDKPLLHNHMPSHRNMMVEDMKKYSLKNQKPSLTIIPIMKMLVTGTSSYNNKAIISKSTCTKLLWKNPSKVVKTPISVLIYQKINQFLSQKKKEKKERKKKQKKKDKDKDKQISHPKI